MSATGEAQRPSAPGRWAAELPLNNRSTLREDGRVKRRAETGSPAPWLGTRWGNAIADRTPGMGIGNPHARRRTRPDDRPTSRAVDTFDVCSNAAVNSDFSCFLYRGRL